MSTRSVVIDATPMLDRSGHRGIGRYVYDLLHGLEGIRDEWKNVLDVGAVTALRWHGDATLDTNLAQAAESVYARRGSLQSSVRWRRRVSLGAFARSADLLHLTEAIGVPFARSTRWAVTCYDLIPLRMPDEYLGGNPLRIRKRHLEDWVRYHRSDQIVSISERTRTDVINILAVDPAKVVAVPTGIDLRQWLSGPLADDVQRRTRLTAGGRPYVLFVGAGDQRKGIATMFNALARARREIDVELVWVGKLPDPALRRFRAEAERVGIGSAVRFTGFLPDADLSALYRGALGYVFLSVLEGFGLPVAEAIAAGCPVIVVRGSGCEEIAGDAGFVVPPNDPEAASAAILSLARDPEDRERRIRIGRERAPRYDRKAMARGYVETWLRMLSVPR